MKKTVCSLIALAVALMMCATCTVTAADSAIDTILTAGTAQSFTDEPVAEEDLIMILRAGVAAESAINQQPWFFVAVTDHEVMEKLSGSGFTPPAGGPGPMPAGGPGEPPAGGPGEPPAGMPSGSGSPKASLGDSPAAIIIYMNEKTASPNASFDCGLAAQNMYIAAASLGYGVKIVSSPTMTLNGADHDALCELLGVDPAMQAVAVLLIGRPDTNTDLTTGASPRADLGDKVSLITG